jgi:WD repeat-containing protein 92
MEKPQIVVYSEKSLNYTAYDVKWIPSSPKFVVMGQQPNGTGILQVMKLQQGKIEVINQVFLLK